MNFTKIEENIFVYNNMFADLQHTVKELTSNKIWSEWYTFGDQSMITVSPIIFNNFPQDSEWKSYVDDSKFIIGVEKEILNIFYNTTSHYIKENKIIQDNWSMEPPHICRYFDSHGTDPETGTAMHFHADFPQEDTDSPGTKQTITCNMYLNDDYENGEIVFKIFKDNENFDKVTYKPVAGDVVIFPSNDPYYHAVNVAKNGEKVFVRSFWYQDFPGSKEWHENLQKYGKDVWLKMHNDKVTESRKNGEYLKNDY